MCKSGFVQRFFPPVYVRIVVWVNTCTESLQFPDIVACGQTVSTQCGIESVRIRIGVCKVRRAELGVNAEVIVYLYF